MKKISMKAKAVSAPKLLFLEFYCPFCGEDNVLAKWIKTEYVLCSRSSCRRVIQIENLEEVA